MPMRVLVYGYGFYGRRWGWGSFVVFVAGLSTIGGMVFFATSVWKPGNGPIVGTEEGRPFFVGTIITQDGSISVDSVDTSDDKPTDAVLAAACHNYGDWLTDVTVDTNLIIVTPDDGLLRSAELLDGEFDLTPAVLEAERLATLNQENPRDAFEQMRTGDDWEPPELTEARRYLDARATPPSPDTAERYVFYVANVTRESAMIARLEVDPESELRKRPFSRIGEINVQRPDDTIIGIDESKCWT